MKFNRPLGGEGGGAFNALGFALFNYFSGFYKYSEQQPMQSKDFMRLNVPQ
jgi:hypothetical protein